MYSSHGLKEDTNKIEKKNPVLPLRPRILVKKRNLLFFGAYSYTEVYLDIFFIKPPAEAISVFTMSSLMERYKTFKRPSSGEVQVYTMYLKDV